jgi:short subunit dehydrogenase-like uncharacterized protein
MLYGAYGYTGKLILEEALQRGHRPILAGRNAEKLKALADQHDLEYRPFDLNNQSVIEAALQDVDVVLHAAGPFTFTAAPMRKACLQTGTHYLDVTGEIEVFESTFELDALAKQRGIVMVSGVGFDVVPTDCMAMHIHERMPDAVKLLVGLKTGGRGSLTTSAGSLKSMLEILKAGNVARREGQLVAIPLGITTRIPFNNKEYIVVAFPWGDLSTAYRSTGIPHITTFLVISRRLIRWLQMGGPLVPVILKVKPLRRLLQWWMDRQRKDKPARLGDAQGRSYVYVRAENATGDIVESWLETLEGYQLTAMTAVRAVEHVLADQPTGALTPGQLLGKDFILSIEGTTRHDG